MVLAHRSAWRGPSQAIGERFVTPTVIKVFYWLAVVICVLLGAAGAATTAKRAL